MIKKSVTGSILLVLNFNKMKKILLFVLVVLLWVGSMAYAHPWRTDKKGCHTCKTNCAKWGLKYGQYHCHKSK